MKKIAALLSAALVLALAAPAFAAVEFGGKLSTEFKLHEVAGDWVVDGTTGLDIKTEVKAEGGDPVKAVVQLKPWRFAAGFTDGKPTAPFENPGYGVMDQIEVDKAWVETEGAYWHGGPAVHTRIGDVTINWNDYVAYLEGRRGITVVGMPIGPAQVGAFYAWDTTDATRPYGITAGANIEGIDLSGILVRKGNVNNYALNGRMTVMPGVGMNADLAIDGANNLLYRAEAELDGLVEGVKVTAAYRGANDAFRPVYTIPAKDKNGATIGTGFDPADRNDEANVNYDLLDGFSLRAETTQSGVHMVAGYDQPTQIADFAADTVIEGFGLAGKTKVRAGSIQETELSIAKGLNLGGFDVNASYAAKIVPSADIEHTVKASTKTDAIAQLQGLELGGQVKLVGNNITWKTNAGYSAPNGLNFGAEYDSAAGASATAGVTVQF